MRTHTLKAVNEATYFICYWSYFGLDVTAGTMINAIQQHQFFLAWFYRIVSS